MKEQHRVFHDFRFVGRNKQQGKLVGQPPHDNGNRNGINHHHQRGRLDSHPNAFGLSGSVVLSRVRGHGHSQGIERTHHEHLDTHGCREGGDAGCAQSIVRTLQHDASDGSDGELQAHWHSDGQKLTGQIFPENTVGRLSFQYVELAVHIDVAQHSRKSLREDRGNASTGDAPSQRKNKKQVKNDVQHRREQQKPERRLAVAQRPDNTGKQIVEKRTRHTYKRDEQINIGTFKDIFRRLHGPQNESAKQTGDDGHRYRHHRRQLQADRHITPHRHIVARTEFLCHRNTETTATSVAESQYKEYHRRAGAYRCQRINAKKPSHNGSIHQRIRLLKHVSKQQRKSKIQNQRQTRP